MKANLGAEDEEKMKNEKIVLTLIWRLNRI